MTVYKVFVNGKIFMEKADSKELKEIFGFSHEKASYLSNNHVPETVEIRLEKVGEKKKKLNDKALFCANYGKENYNQWVMLNKRYGKRVKA